MTQRLQKFMAENGIASRRKSEELITSGVVRVNGATVTELGHKIDSEKDIVEVNGQIIEPQNTKLFYYLLNKPKGYVSTAKDQFGRPSVVSLIKSDVRLYPVGRLDYDTEGLIIITNDGDFTNKLTHPSYSITKEYEATVKGSVGSDKIENFRQGIDIGEYVTKSAKMQIIQQNKDSSVIRIVIAEGKNRQVRKMCAAIGHEVLYLKRTAIGNLTLGGLAVGEYRELLRDEVLGLVSAASLARER